MARYGFRAPTKPTGENAVDPRILPAHLCQSALERDYPRVMENILTMWGFQELNTYFAKLAMDDRGDRAGFPKEVWEDLDMLHHLHQTIIPGPSF